jgi:glycosyltransferase involved in cell wall biosynthesis
MRVMMVVHDFLPRHRAGTEIYAAALGEALAVADDLELCFVVTESHAGARPGRVNRRLWRGLEVVEIEHDHRVETIEAGMRSAESLAVLRDEIEGFRPDVVHFQHTLFFGWEALAIARRAGARVVLTLHDFHAVCPRQARMRRADGGRCESAVLETCAACTVEFFPRVAAAAPRPGRLRRAAALLPEAVKAPLRRLRSAVSPVTAPPAQPPPPGDEADDDRARARITEARRDLAARRALVAEMMPLADLIISPSAFLKERLIASGVPGAASILVSSNGQDPRGLNPAGREPKSGGLRVGFVGTVTEAKGVAVLVEAAARLASRPENAPRIEIRIHGALDVDPQFARDVQSRAASISGASLTFAGGFAPDELAGVLATLDVLVVPSLWWENAPLTIQEAFLAGLVPVVSDIGGMAEAVRDGRDGRHFQVGDSADLARVLAELADDDAQLAALRAAAPKVKSVREDARAMRSRYEGLLTAPSSPEAKTESPRVSVVIPTLNGGELFQTVLDRVLGQELDEGFEVIVIDSGSNDGTVARLRRRPSVRLVQIEAADFNHGLTRQRGVDMARGDFVCFLTQDAVPADSQLLANLLRPLKDAAVAGVYARQRPRPECNPFQKERLRGWADEEETQYRRLESAATWGELEPRERHALCAYDHVAAMSRRSDLLARPLEERDFGEDLAWGKAAILAGRTLVMEPTAVVIHSHERSIADEAARVRADHRELRALFGLQTMPSLSYALAAGLKSTWRHLRLAWNHRDGGRWRWIWRAPLFAMTQNLAQYLGARDP